MCRQKVDITLASEVAPACSTFYLPSRRAATDLNHNERAMWFVLCLLVVGFCKNG